MRRTRSAIAIVAVLLLLLGFWWSYQVWENREWTFEEKPYRVLKPVVHALQVNPWHYIITYVAPNGLLEKERLQTDRKTFFSITGVEPQKPPQVAFYRAYRKPFLWYRDRKPYKTKIEIRLEYHASGEFKSDQRIKEK